ncbi:MAG TPA: alkaline phosphatase family protein [Anaerolineales bacterium]|nr:alkaline phosphatase family protein [Anaerolineales bacterium]
MRTLIIGLDAFDPAFFEKLHSQGKTPHLSKLLEAGGYSRFRVSDPPQSEVSWTSIATGMNPGGHGMFDFVHRNPANYSLQVSLLPTQKNLLGLQFVPPYNAQTIFDEAVEDGYPATSMWWPATFPAKQASPVQTIPGLGTPDILGRLGVGTYFSVEELPANAERKTAVRSLIKKGATRFSGTLEGPAKKNGTVNIDFELDINDATAMLHVAKQKVLLKLGEWGEIVELPFSVGFGMTIKAISRAILTSLNPLSVYFLPLQLHPLGSPWPYATPKNFIQDQWKKNGPFLTLGWPQDTTALNEELINDEQFLKLCEMIDAERERVLNHSLDSFDEGLLACVFDSLDRVQHMFFKGREDVIEAWYIRLDAMIGRIMARAARKKTKVIIVSDHGFGRFDYKVHLNRWLSERGYLKTTNPALRQTQGIASSDLRAVNWSQTQAYALGLNSLYLNLAGREGQGIVSDATQTLAKLKEDLLQWKGPNGEAVVQSALIRDEVFQGPLAAYGPDIFIGYRPPYRGSAETGLGQWRSEAIEKNTEHWEADHCFDSRAVPGVLFSNEGLGNFSSPSYRDIPALTIGKDLKTQASAPPPKYSDEDQDEIEKRLKDLGYL